MVHWYTGSAAQRFWISFCNDPELSIILINSHKLK
jgi:hypothetical protein